MKNVADISEAYKRLAKHVLEQADRDNRPNDFGPINPEDSSSGTYKDFWEGVLRVDKFVEDQSNSSLTVPKQVSDE